MANPTAVNSKLYVLDTNVLLHEPLAFLSFQEHDVMIPMTVLEELDHIKDGKKDVAREARIAIRSLDDLLHQASPEAMLQGVPMPPVADGSERGRLIIVNDHLFADSISGLPGNENDHRIINTAMHMQKQHAKAKVVLVTKDINMRLKAKGAGLHYVEDYRTDQLIDDVAMLAKGYDTIEGDFWQQVGQCESQQVGVHTHHFIPRFALSEIQHPFYLNQYLIDERTDFAAKVVDINSDGVTLQDLGRGNLLAKRAWGISPKNIYQGMALDALLDPEIDLVILTGPAGCGKTGITASFFSIFVQTYLQTLFLLKKLSIYNRLRSNLSNMSLSVT